MRISCNDFKIKLVEGNCKILCIYVAMGIYLYFFFFLGPYIKFSFYLILYNLNFIITEEDKNRG